MIAREAFMVKDPPAARPLSPGTWDQVFKNDYNDYNDHKALEPWDQFFLSLSLVIVLGSFLKCPQSPRLWLALKYYIISVPNRGGSQLKQPPCILSRILSILPARPGPVLVGTQKLLRLEENFLLALPQIPREENKLARIFVALRLIFLIIVPVLVV